MRRTKRLKAVADLELREGRPLRAALAYWTQVLREPDDAPAHFGLADALLFLENYDFGGEMVREGLRTAPRWLEADIDKRGFLDDPEPLMKAIAKLEKHVAELPAAAAARFLLGFNLLFTGRAADAIPHLEAAARVWAGDPVPAQTLRAARERASAGKR